MTNDKEQTSSAQRTNECASDLTLDQLYPSWGKGASPSPAPAPPQVELEMLLTNLAYAHNEPPGGIRDAKDELLAYIVRQSPAQSSEALLAECRAVFDLMLDGCNEQKFGDFQNGHGEEIGPRMDELHAKLRATPTATSSQPATLSLDRYDAGQLSDFGGGNVDWWWDYLRAELDRAHDFYQSQAATSSEAAPTDRDAVLEEAANAVASTNTLGMTAPSAITKLCAIIRALKGKASSEAAAPDLSGLNAELDKMWRARFILGQSLHNVMVGNQSAWIEWKHGKGAEAAMEWIENGLIGPGLIPSGTEAQPWFDANQDDRYDIPPRPAVKVADVHAALSKSPTSLAGSGEKGGEA